MLLENCKLMSEKSDQLLPCLSKHLTLQVCNKINLVNLILTLQVCLQEGSVREFSRFSCCCLLGICTTFDMDILILTCSCQ